MILLYNRLLYKLFLLYLINGPVTGGGGRSVLDVGGGADVAAVRDGGASEAAQRGQPDARQAQRGPRVRGN